MVPASVLLALVSLLATAGVWALTSRETPERSERPEGIERPALRRIEALSALREWDDRRADAWAAGDVAELRGLYVEGSRTGRSDTRMLRRYLERGLVVRGMRTQLLAVRVLHQGSVTMTLDVTDRVSGAQVVGEGIAVPLPRDQASRRRVELQRVRGRWLVVEVRAPSGAG